MSVTWSVGCWRQTTFSEDVYTDLIQARRLISQASRIRWTRVGMTCRKSIYCTSATMRPADPNGMTSFQVNGMTMSYQRGWR